MCQSLLLIMESLFSISIINVYNPMTDAEEIKEFLVNFTVNTQTVAKNSILLVGDHKEKKGIISIYQSFTETNPFGNLLKTIDNIQKQTENDAFSCYTATSISNNHLRIIYPATDEKIKKYSKINKKKYVPETPKEYKKFIEEMIKDTDSLKWLINIIDQSNHLLLHNELLYPDLKEKIYYNDNKFVIISNYKWNEERIDDLYILLLFKDTSLYTIREVKCADDLILAKNAIVTTLSECFKLELSDVLIYFHYHPTYYSLHLHVVNVNLSGSFVNAGRVIFIDDAINRLKTDPDYYRNGVMYHIKTM